MDTKCKCCDHSECVQSNVNGSHDCVEYSYESLLSAIQHGKTSDVHKIFDNLKTNNVSHIDIFSLLRVAVLQNMVCIVKYLLFFCNKEDLNKVDKDGCSLIYWALTRPSCTIVEYLLLKGVDVNLKNASGTTALHYVVSIKWIIHRFPKYKRDNNFIKTFTSVFSELLIKNGADINYCNCDGYNPLHFAVKGSNYDAVKILLAHKAELNCSSREGTPMHIAIQKCNLNIVQTLLYSGARINAIDSYGNTSLHHALRQKCYDMVHLFLDSDQNISECINVLNCNNETALHVAVQFAPIDVINKLIHKGANLNSQNYCGNTPLMNAFMTIKSAYSQDSCLSSGINGDKNSCRLCSITKIFLNNKTDISIENNFGHSIFHQGLMGRRVCTMKILLNTSVSSKLLNELMTNLLRYITEPHTVPLLKLLIEYGADVNCKINYNGLTSLHMVARNAINFPLKLKEVECYLKTLLDAGADVNSLNTNGETPLHLVLQLGGGDLSVLSIVKLLLDSGASVFIKCKKGHTALNLVDHLEKIGYGDTCAKKIKDCVYSYVLMYAIAEWPTYTEENWIPRFPEMDNKYIYTECKNEIVLMKTISIHSYFLYDLIHPNNFSLLESQSIAFLEELDKYLIGLPKYSSIIKATAVRAIVRKKKQQVLDSGVLFLNKVINNYKFRKGALRDCYDNILKYLCYNDFKNMSQIVTEADINLVT